MGFGERWIRWIKYSFPTIKYSVLVNRSLVGFSSPGRGIRQGDPLSPFLFIFATEGLSRMLEKAKQLQWIEGFEVAMVMVHLSRSHIFYLLMTPWFSVELRNFHCNILVSALCSLKHYQVSTSTCPRALYNL